MNINQQFLEEIMGPIVHNDQALKVSLFIVSKKDPRLKKLNLDASLSSEKRAEKLHQWAEDQRFVAIIEMGDKIFAHVSHKFANQLENQKDLSIEGKKVAVKALTDEEAEKLSIVGEKLGEYVLEDSKEESISQDEQEETAQGLGPRYAMRQYLAMTYLVSDQMYMEHVIARMENVPGQVILDCLKHFEEARREDKKRKEADEKYFDIKHQEIKKSLKKEEIRREEIEIQGQNQAVTAQDAQRINRIRRVST